MHGGIPRGGSLRAFCHLPSAARRHCCGAARCGYLVTVKSFDSVPAWRPVAASMPQAEKV